MSLRHTIAFSAGLTLAAAMLTGTTAGAAGAAEPVVLANLLARAGEAVRHFEEAFTLVISDETYQQNLSAPALPGPIGRRTTAEMFFEWQPEAQLWLNLRSVVTLDGKPVTGSANRLADALNQPAGARASRIRALLEDNARFNLGTTVRTFNYPTFVLSYLDPLLQPRFAFTLAGQERVGNDDTAKVTFVEQARPTFIQGEGFDRISRGAVWLRHADGVPVRTRLELAMLRDDANSYATVEVNFARNARLDMWVPVRMREVYMEVRDTRIKETLIAEASYSNFRRFETAVRIMPAPAGRSPSR